MEQAVLAPRPHNAHPHNAQLTHCHFLSRLLSIMLASARKLSQPFLGPQGQARGGGVRATAREGGRDRSLHKPEGGSTQERRIGLYVVGTWFLTWQILDLGLG